MAGQSISKGALTLTTDAAQLQSGLSKAQKQIADFGSSIQGLLSVDVGLHMFDKLKGAYDSFKETIKSAGDEAETTLANAMAFGTTAENLQAISGAAQLAGVDTEQFSNILRVAADTAGDAAKGGEDVVKKLQQIGLATTDLAGQNGPDALNIIMDALKKIGNESDRIKAIDDIFGGKRALQVVKLLNADLGDLSEKFKEMGLVLSKQELEKLDEFGDKVQLAEKRLGHWKNKAIVWSGEVVKAFEEFFSGEDWTVAKTETLKQRAEADQKHWDMVSREMDAAQRISDIQAKARKDKFTKDLDTARAKEYTDYLEKIVSLSQSAIAADPIDSFAKTLEGLDYQLQFGKISFDQYDAAVVKSYDSLLKLAGLGGELKLPSAVVAGSVEDIASRNQNLAQANFASSMPGGQIQSMLNAQKEANKALADRILRSPEIRELINNTAPLQNIKGGF